LENLLKKKLLLIWGKFAGCRPAKQNLLLLSSRGRSLLHCNHFLRGLLLLGLLLNQDLLSLMLVKNLLGTRVTAIGDCTSNGS